MDEVILRTIVIQFDGRVVEVFGNSAEAMRGHVALMREPKIGKPDYRGRSEVHVHGCRFGVADDELPKLLPLLDKITAAVRAAQSERQPRLGTRQARPTLAGGRLARLALQGACPYRNSRRDGPAGAAP